MEPATMLSSQPARTRPAETAEAIRTLAMGFILPRCLHLAAELDVAGRLGDGELSADTLARDTDTRADALYRMLRALACHGIFEETAERHFRNTPASHHLIDGRPGSLRSWVRLYGSVRTWESWGAFELTVRTGQPAFEHLHGQGVFDALGQNPGAAAIFDAAMLENSSLTAPAVAEAYDFSGIGRVVDVGGGRGTMIRALLERHPHLRGTVFDLPHAAAGAAAFLSSAGLGERAMFEAGDFFDRVPAGGDAYFLQRVLHDWDDASCLRILSNVARAMGPSSRILVSEQVLVPGGTAPVTLATDLHMMVMTHGGRERSEAEFAALFSAAGLEWTRTVPTASVLSVVEGRLRRE